MAQLQTAHSIFLLSAGSKCVCAAAVHCYVGLEMAITTKPLPNYCSQYEAVGYEYQKRQDEKPKITKDLTLSFCVSGLYAITSQSSVSGLLLNGD